MTETYCMSQPVFIVSGSGNGTDSVLHLKPPQGYIKKAHSQTYAPNHRRLSHEFRGWSRRSERQIGNNLKFVGWRTRLEHVFRTVVYVVLP